MPGSMEATALIELGAPTMATEKDSLEEETISLEAGGEDLLVFQNMSLCFKLMSLLGSSLEMIHGVTRLP